jgi:GNAT superfamily N-acetyltransferase
MEIRRARPEELDEIGELTALAYEAFTLGPDDPYIERLKDAAARDREGELWVAVEGDRLLGNVTYCPAGTPWREIGAGHEGEFRMLAVHPEARGFGAGTALAVHCEQRARQQGATGMALSSLAEMTDAHRIYTRLGYTRAPDRDWTPMPGVHLIAFSKVF